jgi:hypothetical protein
MLHVRTQQVMMHADAEVNRSPRRRQFNVRSELSAHRLTAPF